MARGRPRKHKAGEMCEECGVAEKQYKGVSTAGNPLYRRTCQSCHIKYRRPWARHKGVVCELCGYEPFWRRALDVHHRNGEKSDNSPENLMTLCANCHRELEAEIHNRNGDWEEAESWLKKMVRKFL